MNERAKGLDWNVFKDSDFFKTARDLASLSGLTEAEQKDVVNVAYARVFWEKDLVSRGEEVPPYEGRHKGVVELVTNSMLSKIGFFENSPLPE